MNISFVLPIYELNDDAVETISSFLSELSSICTISSLIVVYKICSSQSTIKHNQLILLKQSSLNLRIFGAINQAVSCSSNKYVYIFGLDDILNLANLSSIFKKYIPNSCSSDLLIFCRGLPFSIYDHWKLFFRFREHCQQHIIYSLSFLKANLFNEYFDINADHIAHLLSIRNASSYLLVPSQFAVVGPHGVSSQELNFGYISSIYSLRLYYGGFLSSIYFKSISAIRFMYRRHSRLLSAKPAIYVLFCSCNYELLVMCLDNFLSSLSELTDTHKNRFSGFSVVLDIRSFTLQQQTYLKQAYPDFTFFLFNAPNSSTVRTDIRNFGVDCLRLDPSSNASILFFDGDLIISPQLLNDYLNRSLYSSLVLGHTLYLSRTSSACLSKVFKPNLIESLSGFFIGFRRYIFSFLLFSPMRKFLPSYSPTLGAGNFLIHYSLLLSSGGFLSLIDGWGGEDVYLGYRLYKMGFLPSMINPFNSAFHLYHNTLDSSQRHRLNLYVRQLIKSQT